MPRTRNNKQNKRRRRISRRRQRGGNLCQNYGFSSNLCNFNEINDKFMIF